METNLLDLKRECDRRRKAVMAAGWAAVALLSLITGAFGVTAGALTIAGILAVSARKRLPTPG